MERFSQEILAAWDKDFRANFFHSATGVKPAILIGTKNLAGISNVAIFSSVFHLGSTPPIFGFMVRPGESEGNTFDNILKTGGYTMSLVPTNAVEAAHQTAARYAPEQNEFEETQLPESELDGFPILAHAPVVMRLKYLETLPIQYNQTKIVLGEVVAVGVNPDTLLSSGLIDHEIAHTVSVTGLDTYYKSQKIARMAYAKPNLPPRKIDF